jgi:5,10-methylenetetrahydromethanopterin reductase
MLQLIQHAEAIGLQEIWLGDEGPARDPLAILAAAAVRTRRIRLGVGVTNPYLRHPAATATSMMTINELSAGRALLGLGLGGDLSLGPFGIIPTRPLATMRRAIGCMRAVFHGQAREGYRPPVSAVTSPDLPIFVGARSPKLNRLASRLADGAFVAGVPVAQVAEVVGWARSLRPIQIALYVSVAFEAEHVERTRPHMAWGLLNSSEQTLALAGRPREVVRSATDALAAGDAQPARELMSDDVLRHVLVWGEPAAIGLRLAQLVRELGPDSIGLSLVQVPDPMKALDACAVAFASMRAELANTAAR